MSDEPAAAAGPLPSRAPATSGLAKSGPVMPELQRKRDLLPILYVIGFLVLAGALFFLWQNPPASKLAQQETGALSELKQQVTELQNRVASLSQQPASASETELATLRQQVAGLQARPVVAPDVVQQLGAKVGALESRPVVAPDTVQALAGKVTALESKPSVDPAAVQQLDAKLTALQDRKVVTPEQLAAVSDQVQAVGQKIPDIKPLEQHVASLEQRPTFDPAAASARFTEIGTKLQQAQDADGKLGGSVDALQKQQAGLADQIKALTQKAQIMARLQGMAAALAGGQKLGDIPGAPPALARFATEAPPTEAGLRESFDRYADAAQKASQPAIAQNQDFGQRLWSRAQQAVTVRQGDHVLVGDPIAGVMAHARDKLVNGDLAGSVEALKGLTGAPATAMQPWVDQAQSLVAARAAIANLAAN